MLNHLEKVTKEVDIERLWQACGFITSPIANLDSMEIVESLENVPEQIGDSDEQDFFFGWCAQMWVDLVCTYVTGVVAKALHQNTPVGS